MDRVSKEQRVESLRGLLAGVQGLVLTNFKGLSVQRMTDLRAECRKAGARYLVIKNTLLGLAAKGTSMDGIRPYLKGQTGMLYSTSDPGLPFKAMEAIAKKFDMLVAKAGWLDGQAGDASVVSAWARLPGRAEAQAQLLSAMLAVPRKFLGLLQASQRNFLGVLEARKDALAGGGAA